MNIQDLPKPLQTLLQISKVNRIKIDLSKKDNDFTPTLNSKVGGVGYLPINEKYPTKKDGTPLGLLAQLNFKQIADTVDTTKLPHPLPKQGILQIYIDGQDDDALYGCDLDDYLPHDKYQVRFWQDDSLPMHTDELNHIITQLKSLSMQGFPFDYANAYDMRFELSTQSCTTNCYEYNHQSQTIDELKTCDVWNYLEENLDMDDSDPDEVLEIYDELANSYEHQLLGYPNFTQTDPREYNESLQQHILLFQIETDDDNDIMWGDSGVANFFIHPNDLKNQDFSKLLYNWDCY